MLHRHYRMNVAPVLFMELLGDLRKYADNQKRAEAAVTQLANRLSTMDYQLNAHYKGLVTQELLGARVPMVGFPIAAKGVSYESPDGSRGFAVDETPEDDALFRWSQGDFKQADYALAQRWRD